MALKPLTTEMKTWILDQIQEQMRSNKEDLTDVVKAESLAIQGALKVIQNDHQKGKKVQ